MGTLNYITGVGSFFVVESKALGSTVWIDILAIDDADLNYHGSADAQKYPHVADVAKGMLVLAGRPLVEEDVDLHIWCYIYYTGHPYVKTLCALTANELVSWRGRYILHPDAICW